MVKKWMKERKRYMFGFDGREDTENVTQLVWRKSQEIGGMVLLYLIHPGTYQINMPRMYFYHLNTNFF